MKASLASIVLLIAAMATMAAEPEVGEPEVPDRSTSRPDDAPNAVAEPSAETVDPGAETATHREMEPLDIEFQQLSALQLAPDGMLYACDLSAKLLRVIDPQGKLARTIDLPFGPEAVDIAADGTVYCGGQGRLARLTAKGEIDTSTSVPENSASEIQPRRRAWSKPLRVSGLAVAKDDVFVAFGSGWSLGSKSKLFRFDRELQEPELLAEGLRGCCQRCDIATHDGIVYVAENSAYRVVCFNREGDILAKWGEQSRYALEGFGSCCNPMNLAFDAAGTLYTAESGLGRVKTYTTDGKYLGLVGYVGVERFSRAGGLAASCSNVAIAVTPDGNRVYVMDFKQNIIRVLQRKSGG